MSCKAAEDGEVSNRVPRSDGPVELENEMVNAALTTLHSSYDSSGAFLFLSLIESYEIWLKCCIIMIMNDACDDVARVRDEREKIHQYRTERERARTLLSYVKRIP